MHFKHPISASLASLAPLFRVDNCFQELEPDLPVVEEYSRAIVCVILQLQQPPNASLEDSAVAMENFL